MNHTITQLPITLPAALPLAGSAAILTTIDPVADAKKELRLRVAEAQLGQKEDRFDLSNGAAVSSEVVRKPDLFTAETSRSVLDNRIWQHPRDMADFRLSNWYQYSFRDLMNSMDQVVTAKSINDYYDALYNYIYKLSDFISLPLKEPEADAFHYGEQKWIFYVSAWDSLDLLWKTVMDQEKAIGSLFASFGQLIGTIGVKLLLSPPDREPLTSYQKVLDRFQEVTLILEQCKHNRFAIEVSRDLREIGIDLITLSNKANLDDAARNRASDAIQWHLDLAYSYGNIAPPDNYKALQHFKSAIDLGLKINSKVARTMYQLLRDGFDDVPNKDRLLAEYIVNNYLDMQNFEYPEDKLEAQMLLGLVYAQKYSSRRSGYNWIRQSLNEYVAGFNPREGGLSDYDDLSIDRSWDNASRAPLMIVSLFLKTFSIQAGDIPFKWFSLWIYECLGTPDLVDSLLSEIFRLSWYEHKSSLGLFDIADELKVWPTKYYKKLVNILSNAHRAWDEVDKSTLNDVMVNIYKSWPTSQKLLFNEALKRAAEKYGHSKKYQSWFQNAVR